VNGVANQPEHALSGPSNRDRKRLFLKPSRWRMSVAGSALRASRALRWSPRASFLVVAATLAVLVGGSNIPTPLFPLYQREYHFGSATLTLLFSTYVFALIPSLLTLGRLSDRAGRRPVIVSGLALTALSSMAFA